MTYHEFIEERKAEGLSQGQAMAKAYEFEEAGGRFWPMNYDQFVIFCNTQGYAEELIPQLWMLYAGK